MKTSRWIMIAIVVGSLGFLVGYKASSSTPIQPGYFETAEAGGYGGEPDVEGIDKDAQDFYKNLYKNE